MATWVENSDVNNIPKAKSISGSGTHQTINSGIVDIKCVINRLCPFLKSDFVNQTYVFNSQSIRNWPVEMKDRISTVTGLEGVFLNESVVYRHTYLDAKKKNGGGIDRLEDNKVSQVAGTKVYRREQRFLIKAGLFDDTIAFPEDYRTKAYDSGASCDQSARWSYNPIALAYDLKADTPEHQILMPTMISNTTCTGKGVHWRAEKQTPLFKGEDFFVEFHKLAISKDVPASTVQAIQGAQADNDTVTGSYAGQAAGKFKHDYYRPLDVTYNKFDEIPGCDGARLYCNSGIVSRDANGDISNGHVYDFRFKPYYIVEIGIPAKEDSNERKKSGEVVKDRYFIVIADKAPIRMIRIGNPIYGKATKDASVLISTFDEARVIRNNQPTTGGLSGEQLMEAKWFRMHVRNHLGKLVVQFFTDSWKSSHWIITRSDNWWTSKGKIEKKAVPIYIPRGKISLWGGNMRSGFLFGPLHYRSPDSGRGRISFSFPLENTVTKAISTCGDSDTKDGSGEHNPYNTVSLPSAAYHKILLSAADDNVLKVIGKTKKLYTQDAQLFHFFDETSEKEVSTDKGSFYKKDPYKAFDSRGEDYYSSIQVYKINLGRGSSAQRDIKSKADLFKVGIRLKPGGHKFSSGQSPDFEDGDGDGDWYLDGVKTPIFTMFRLVADPNNESRWTAEPKDVSDNILQYSDSWAAQDFTRIDHTGNIQFLINAGADFENNQTDYLTSLINKVFYIEIWAGYSDALNSDNVTSIGSGCNYSKLPGYYKLFTGLCYGGSVTGDPGKRVMESQIFDYSKPLEHMLYFNAPFFDGVRDVNAVNEVLKTAGFKQEKVEDPGFLLASCAKSANQQHMYKMVGIDGRPVFIQPMALPNAYNKLAQPYFKPKDASKLLDTILGMAKKTGKCFFFDSYGVAHYESYLDYSVLGVIAGIDTEMLTGNPPDCSSGVPTTVTVNPSELALWWYTTNPNIFSGQLVYDTIKGERVVQDVYNHTKILTSTPDFELIIGDNIDWDSIEQPAKEGFIGYKKTVYQQDGIFGSLEAAKRITKFYEAMRSPPLTISFNSFGLPVRALDTVYFDGQPLRVMKVATTIDPKDNKWMNNLECEWLFPIQFNLASTSCSKT